MVSIPPDERCWWGTVVDRLCDDVKWFEALSERAKPFVYCTINVASRNYDEFISVLRAKGILWDPRVEFHYTDAELQGFPLLRLGIDRKPLAEGGLENGTEYDYVTGCPHCGTGATQSGPLILHRQSLERKRGIVQAGGGEVLIDREIYHHLINSDINDVECRELFDNEGNGIPGWRQLMPSVVMERVDPQTRGIVRDPKAPPCPHCQRDGHYHTRKVPLEIIYKKPFAKYGIPSVVATWECFGRSARHELANGGLAPPMILVRPTLFSLFRSCGCRDVVFEPVRIDA